MARMAWVLAAALAAASPAGPAGAALQGQTDRAQGTEGVAIDAAARPDDPILGWAAGFELRSGCALRVEAAGSLYERITFPEAEGLRDPDRTQACVIELLRSLMRPPAR